MYILSWSPICFYRCYEKAVFKMITYCITATVLYTLMIVEELENEVVKDDSNEHENMQISKIFFLSIKYFYAVLKFLAFEINCFLDLSKTNAEK